MAITLAQREALIEMYVAIPGRAPDADGLAFWADALENGASFAFIAQEMWESAPAQALYPASMTVEEIVTAIYENVLGRSPDVDGLAYWVGRWNANGSGNEGATMQEMITSIKTWAPADPDNLTALDIEALAAQQLFADKVEFGEWFAMELKSNDTDLAALGFDILQNGGSIADAQADILDAVKEIHNLTPGQDTITINAPLTPDVVKGLVGGANATLTPGDSITGNNHTVLDLTVVDTGAAGPFVTLNKVGAINFTAGATGTIDFNANSWTNIGSVNLVGGNGWLEVEVNNLEDGTDLSVSGVYGALDVDYKSGIEVWIGADENSSASLIDSNIVLDSAAGEWASITMTGNTGNAITVGSVMLAAAANGYVEAEIYTTGADLTVGDVTVDLAQSASGDIEFYANTGNLTVGNISAALGVDSSFTAYITADSGDTTVGDLSFDLAKDAYANIDIWAESVGDVTVGNVVASVGESAEFWLDIEAETGDVTVGNIDITGMANASYSVSVSSTETGDVTIGNVSMQGGDYIGLFAWNEDGLGGNKLTVGNVDISVDQSGEAYFSASNSNSGNVGGGDLTVGNINFVVGDDAYGVIDLENYAYQAAAAAVSGVLAVGDITAVVGADATFYLDLENYAYSTGNVGALTVGDIDISVGIGGYFEASFSAENYGTGNVAGVTIGDVSINLDDGADGYLYQYGYANNGNVGTLTAGDYNVTLGVQSYLYSSIDTYAAAGVAGNIVVGDLDLNLGLSSTFSLDIDSTGLTDGNVTVGNINLAGEGLFVLEIGGLGYTGDVTIGDITVAISDSGDLATDILGGVATTGTVTVGDIDYSAYGTAASIDVSGYVGAANIVGSAFDDIITTNVGKNVMTGGTGADTFVINASSNALTAATADVITDFEVNVDKIQIDLVELEGVQAYYEGTYADFAAFMAGAATQASSVPDDNIIAGQVGNDVWVAFDITGNNVIDHVIQLVGINIADLDYADFLVV